jgi:hypothetical protein
MGEQIAAELKVGGPVPRQLIPALCRLIGAAGVGLDWGESNFAPATEADLLEAVETEGGQGLLVLRDDEASWGKFPGLETFLRRHDIAFDRHSSPKYEYDGELVHCRPGMEDTQFTATDDGEGFVPLEAVRKIKAALLAGDQATALLLAQEAAPDVPDLPALSFTDDDVADLDDDDEE